MSVEKKLKTILALSIWEDMWSMGESGGVPDELHFIRTLSERGIDLHFLIPESETARDSLDQYGTRYHTYRNLFRTAGALPGALKRLAWFTQFPRVVSGTLRRLAREIGPDVIVGLSHYTLPPVARIGRDLGIPTAVKLFGVMYLARTDLPAARYWWINFDQVLALRHPVDRYIVLNDGTMGETALVRRGIPRDKISFLPNGMDTEWADIAVDRVAVRQQMGLPPGDVLIVTYSRLVASKRIDLFLEAAARIDPARAGGVTFVVAGDGPQRVALERRSRALGIADKVIFTGVIPYSDIVRLLKASDIFVGTNELTNMSMPPCEAILCGVPVVAFDVLGTSEVVQDRRTGFLVRDGDIAGLAERLELLVADADLRSRLGSQAAEFGRGHFVSWDDRIAMEIEILERLCHKRRGSG